MEIKTIVKLTKEEKIALIKTLEILSDFEVAVCDETTLDEVGEVIFGLSNIVKTLQDEYGVDFFQLNE
jgi:hypothetical protein